MSRTRLYRLGLLTSCGLFACASSPPTHYYALSEIAPRSTPAALATGSTGAVPVAVRLEPVNIPPELDRLELVTHSGANRVQIAEVDRWAAPLDEQIRRTLSDDLAARLPAQLMVDPNEPNTQDARRRLSISIAHFDGDANCAVTLNVNWTLQQAKTAGQSGVELVQVPAGAACPAGLAPAMSVALAMLADRLVPIINR
jgi:uncharacterized lipoprotein YmbA